MVKQIEDIYLCKSSGQVLGVLNGINEESCSLTVDVYGRYELSFDVNEYIYSGNELVKANYYDEISILMQLFIPPIGYFIINSSPTSKADSEVKSVAATSIDSELENKNTTFKINCGTKDSLEYIVKYEDGETETLLNGYTGIPYDYITIYNNYDDILTDTLKKYRAGYYNDYRNSDNTEAEYVYPQRIDEIVELCTMIPRLQRKVIENEIVNDNGTTTTNSYIEEYVFYEYEEDGITIKNVLLLEDGANSFEKQLSLLIKFYKKYKSQLSLMDYICSETNNSWSIGHIDEKFCNKRIRFEIESESIYSFLTQELPSAIEGICIFDILNKKINLYAVENIGVDTGINLSYDTVQNQLDVSCDENSIFTRFKVSGGEDLSIKQVNYGTDIIEDLSYFMNYRDSNGKRLYVTDDLYKKYQKYLKYREDNRDTFISLSDQINKLNEEIKEIMYRVPNDGLKTDWNTYTTEELTNLLTTYNNMLVSLITLYKNDYGANGCNEDGSVNEEYLKDTIYWYDYCAYKEIITQIEDTIIIKTDTTLSEEKEKELEAEIDAYKTEWTLYGSKELTNLIESYENQQQVFKDGNTLSFYKEGDKIPEGYSVGDPIPWNNLTEKQKAEYNEDLAGTYPIRYTTYKELDTNKKEAQEYLDILNGQLDELNSQLEELNVSYKALNTNATLKNFSIDGKKVFSDEDLKCLFNLYIDTDYSNENILTTSQDTVSSNLQHSMELLEDAKEKLSIEAQPQYTFSIEMDNILHIDGFEGIVEQFKLGNFIYIEYKNDIYVKMRLVSYTYNPMIIDNELSVEFSNIIKSATKRNDFTYLLDNVTGSSKGSSSSSGGSGGSSSAFGDDLDVTMTNTMLSKLLNTELFGTRVSNVILDTINVNSLTAKCATFGDLYNGTTTVSGDCVSTGVIQSNKTVLIDGMQTPYTIIDLDDGSFSFAADKFTYNSSTDKMTMKDVVIEWDSSTTPEISDIEGLDDCLEQLDTDAVKAQTTADSAKSVAENAQTIGNTLVEGLGFQETEITGKYIISPVIAGGTLLIGDENGTYAQITPEGVLNCAGANISGTLNSSTINGGTISGTQIVTKDEANNITFAVSQYGQATMTSGQIAGMFFQNGQFFTTGGGINAYSADRNGVIFWAGGDEKGNNNRFKVYYDGRVEVVDLTVTGGSISGSKISGSEISIGGDTTNFYVNTNGEVFSGVTTVSAIKISPSSLYNSYVVNFGSLGTAEETGDSVLHLYIGDLYGTAFGDGKTFGEVRLRSKAHIYEDLTVKGRIYSQQSVCPLYDPDDTTEGHIGASLGASNLRWSQLYAKSSTINTSDAKMKHDINPISEKYEKLFYLLEPCTYMFNSGDRVHIGTIAQNLKASMDSIGITNEELSAFCADKKMKTIIDENGEETEVPDLDENGNEQYTYGIRYAEFIMLNTHMLQKLYKKVDEQQGEINNQNIEIENLKQTVKDQQNEINELKTMVNELLGRLS